MSKRAKKIDSDTKKVLVDWPAIGYDSSDQEVAEFYSKAEGTVKERNSIFYKKKLTDIFIYAMVLGKHAGLKEPYLEKGKGRKDSINSEYFADEPRYVWMMNAIALEETNGDLDILLPENARQIVDICEAYANHGIHQLIEIEKTSAGASGFRGYEDMISELLNDG